MTDTLAVATPHGPPGISPAEFARLLPTRVLLSSAEQGWKHITVQRVQYLPSSVVMPAARDHRLALHLAGPTLIEGKGGSRERQWSDSGQATVIPAGAPKARELKGRPDFLLVHLAPALVDEVAAEVHDRDPAGVSLVDCLAVPDEPLDRLGRLLLAEAQDGAPGGRLAADLLTRALAVHLLRRHSSLSPQPPPAAASMPGGRLRRVLDHMQANLAEPLPLTHLAAVGGTSPSQFGRAFREATGEPPHRYLIRLRIEQARNLLEHTTLPVIEIGLRCGFEQPNHFATMFRQMTGMSPRAYRQARCN